MSILHRFQLILCFLLLGGLIAWPVTSSAQRSIPAPRLASVDMSSGMGTITLSGSGFTNGGLVRLIVHDLTGTGPTVEFWTVAEQGELTIDFPYLTGTTFGPHGSQDPAQGFSRGTLDAVPVQAVFGPHGSQDPAQGFQPAMIQWPGACPELLVHALDVRAETWSNTLNVDIDTC